MSKDQTHNYRPDIDGLRALAVLAVVLFHAFPNKFQSGFIGVDIFFVISGYLISSIIFSQLTQGTFSFYSFYRKRILRIFPSLLLVLTFLLASGWYTLLSDELAQLGKHLVAAATFSSNFVLWSESGYFDSSSDTKPLLHLWSLAIEEQYYILFPITVWFAFRKRVRFFPLIAGLGTISFGVNLFYLYSPSIDFYFPIARFWELMLGALLAASFHYRSYSHTIKNALSILGFLLLILGFVLIKNDSIFPGYWATLPTLGAVLLISAGHESLLNRAVLSNPILVWVGRISYPLYLWHWVIFALARILEGATPNRYFMFLFIGISILFAWLSTEFIEAPIRYGTKRSGKEWALAAGLSILGFAGWIIYLQSGFPSRDSRIQQVLYEGDIGQEAFHRYLKEHFPRCSSSIYNEALKYNDIVRCFQSKNDTAPDIAILGDSHAEQFFPGFAEQLKNKNVVYYVKMASPTIDNPEFKNIFTEVLGNPNIKKVILNAYWVDKTLPLESMSLTIDRLLKSNKEVFLFDDIPDFGFDPLRCKSTRLFRESSHCSRSTTDFKIRQSRVHEIQFALKNRHPLLQLINSSQYFCSTEQCSMTHNHQILYRDRHHLNLLGSNFIAEKIIKDHPELVK